MPVELQRQRAPCLAQSRGDILHGVLVLGAQHLDSVGQSMLLARQGQVDGVFTIFGELPLHFVWVARGELARSGHRTRKPVPPAKFGVIEREVPASPIANFH
jgi:hypothetical protein